MYGRLWWKDFRQLWPIWVIVALAAAATQCLLLAVEGESARHGDLGVSAVLWASLYALAAGAAAFAGEREAGTLRTLDVLPADRSVVWVGKVSFALVTSLALALLLTMMAALSSTSWKLSLPQSISVGAGMLVALGCALFWSSILSNALAAAVAAIFCAAIYVGFLSDTLIASYKPHPAFFSYFLAQAALVLATLGGSDLIFTRQRRFGRLPVEFRSPIVMMRDQRDSGARLQIESSGAAAAERVPAPAPMGWTTAPAYVASGALTRASWLVEVRTLAAQTFREGKKTWFWLLASANALPVALMCYDREQLVEGIWFALLSTLAVLVVGSSALGLENRGRTQRFLAYQGARPGLVWLVKIAVWAAAMAVIITMLAGWAIFTARTFSQGDWWQFSLTLPLWFAASVLCGMIFRRGITALVIGLVLSSALMVPLVILIAASLLPAVGLLPVSLALLVVSWAWSGDWMLERPAPGRWVRLGMLVAGASGLLFASYVGYRVWSVRDVGPIAPPAAWAEAAPALLPAERNAAELYREAERRLRDQTGSDTARNADALRAIRQAAARPDCRFAEPASQTLFDSAPAPPVDQFARLLSLEGEKRLDHGDLAGAWEDIVSLLRMARHFTRGAPLGPAHVALVSVERRALALAMDWAFARGQTSERLHSALSVYVDLPKVTPAAEVVRAEAMILENTLDHPSALFRAYLEESRLFGRAGPETPSQQALARIWFHVLAPTWEFARARRVNRLAAAAAIRAASREPGQRPGPIESGLHDSEVEHALETSPRLLRSIVPWTGSFIETADRSEVARRALVQILALRAWQIRHGGRLPYHLGALVPDDIPSLPKDPYSDGPFGYVPSLGQKAPRRMPSNNPGAQAEIVHEIPSPGSWLLYSVGPDRRDNGGLDRPEPKARPDVLWDIVFVIPPLQAAPETGKPPPQGRPGGQSGAAPAK
jgi:hypothetical protein